MKSNYEKIRYREENLRDLQTKKKKKKAENHKFKLLPSPSFLEASTGKVWKWFQSPPKMTED